MPSALCKQNGSLLNLKTHLPSDYYHIHKTIFKGQQHQSHGFLKLLPEFLRPADAFAKCDRLSRLLVRHQ